MHWAFVAAVPVAAGYLYATHKRSRRAATIGLGGVALFATAAFFDLVGFMWEDGLRAVGFPDGRTRFLVGRWVQSAHWSAGFGLLIWAVVADRPPPAGGD